MPEEPKITMTEFKTVLEDVHAKLKIVAEGVQLANEKMDREFAVVRKDIGYLMNKADSLSNEVGSLSNGVDSLSHRMSSLTEQVALLHEGQTEIKNGLKQKVDREEFASLERRVARIESKIA